MFFFVYSVLQSGRSHSCYIGNEWHWVFVHGGGRFLRVWYCLWQLTFLYVINKAVFVSFYCSVQEINTTSLFLLSGKPQSRFSLVKVVEDIVDMFCQYCKLTKYLPHIGSSLIRDYWSKCHMELYVQCIEGIILKKWRMLEPPIARPSCCLYVRSWK
jgi:hypothetical protein